MCKTFMQVNHIGAEDDHTPDNLETVCPPCHSVLHLGVNAMRAQLTVFECKPEVTNMAAIVSVTRSLVARRTPWDEIEQRISKRFARPGGAHYGRRESVRHANAMLHAIQPPAFRGYLPEGLAVMFHEGETWKGFPEWAWKWQCLPGSHYRQQDDQLMRYGV
jgi:hypothetical protein